MDIESETVSGWFVLNSGFKVYGRCPCCQSPNISFHKIRVSGLKGISAASKGIYPVCVDCGKGLPNKLAKETKPISLKAKRKRVY